MRAWIGYRRVDDASIIKATLFARIRMARVERRCAYRFDRSTVRTHVSKPSANPHPLYLNGVIAFRVLVPDSPNPVRLPP